MDNSSPQTPLPWPKNSVELNSRPNTTSPAITMADTAPAAVPRIHQNAPTNGGTMTSNPADAETDSTAIRFRSNWAKRYASTATTGSTILPTRSCCLSVVLFFATAYTSRVNMDESVSMMESIVDTAAAMIDRKSTRLNSSHVAISYAVFCLKKKKQQTHTLIEQDSTHNAVHDDK